MSTMVGWSLSGYVQLTLFIPKMAVAVSKRVFTPTDLPQTTRKEPTGHACLVLHSAGKIPA